MDDYPTYNITLPVLPPSSWQHRASSSQSDSASPAETVYSPQAAAFAAPAAPTTPPKDDTKLLRLTPTVAEWDKHKQVIHDLYMSHNLNLNDVVERLKAFDFYATARMYKAQFARWGWSKYASKRMRKDVSSGKTVVRSQGKSCYRIKRPRSTKSKKASTPTTAPKVASSPVTAIAPSSSSSPAVVPKQMAHVNDTMRFLQSILTDIRSHVCEVSRKSDYNLGQMSKVDLIRGYKMSSCDQFIAAIHSLKRKESAKGNRLLRRAFFDVAGSVKGDYPSVFYWCFIDLPHLLLHNGCDGILRFFLRYMVCLTTNSSLRDCVRGTGLAALHNLAESDPAFLRHYVATASGLWYDLLVELRGPLDRSTIFAQRNLLRHDRGPDYPSRVRRMCENYAVLQADVHSRLGIDHPMTRHLDEAVLSAQLFHDFYLDDFFAANQRLLHTLETKYSTCVTADDTFTTTTILQHPPDTWDVFDRHLRSSCHARLAYAHQYLAGNTLRALDHGRRARQGWQGSPAGGFWHLEAEAALAAAGRYAEADVVALLRLEGQYFGKLPENDEMMHLDAAARHPTVFGVGIKFPPPFMAAAAASAAGSLPESEAVLGIPMLNTVGLEFEDILRPD